MRYLCKLREIVVRIQDFEKEVSKQPYFILGAVRGRQDDVVIGILQDLCCAAVHKTRINFLDKFS